MNINTTSFNTANPALLSNAHTHTLLCDGCDSPEDIVKEAIKKGFHSLGFSGHSYVATDLSAGMKDTENYRKTILELKKKYADKICISLGLECDSLSKIARDKYEYIIGSVHYIRADGKYYPVDCSADTLRALIKTHFNGDAMAAVKKYYKAVAAMAKTLRPEIVGHLDLIKKFNSGGVLFDESCAEYKDAALAAADAAFKNGCITEVNTGGIRGGFTDETYPAPFILSYLSAVDAPVIITSDAHDKASLDYGLDDALRLLKKVGFKRIKQLHSGVFEDVDI
jgi:histidinol-phosphatase (PHP family)